jgi:hypothetical protein
MVPAVLELSGVCDFSRKGELALAIFTVALDTLGRGPGGDENEVENCEQERDAKGVSHGILHSGKSGKGSIRLPGLYPEMIPK